MFPERSSQSDDRRRQVSAGGLSIAIHVLVVMFLLFVPWGTDSSGRRAPLIIRLHEATPLVAPLKEFTQKEPAKGPISKEVNVEGLQPRPPVQAPPSPPPAPLAAYAPPAPTPAPQPALLEPPKMEAPPARSAQLPPEGMTTILPAPPPKIEAEERPKLAFERPGAPSGIPKGAGRLAPPGATIDEAARNAARAGASGAGMIIGDFEGGAGLEALNLRPAPGRTGSNLQLLSDPLGVDFRPYLIQILSMVRRNWLAVVPESVRLGRGGKVVIQFAIDKDGRVPKLVIAMPSGAEALDRAAVAGVSASNPFPPLPGEFKGEQIKVQFSFMYNVK